GTEFLFDHETNRYLLRAGRMLSLAAWIDDDDPSVVRTDTEIEHAKKQVADFFCGFSIMLNQHFQPYLDLSKIGLGKIIPIEPYVVKDPPIPPKPPETVLGAIGNPV